MVGSTALFVAMYDPWRCDIRCLVNNAVRYVLCKNIHHVHTGLAKNVAVGRFRGIKDLLNMNVVREQGFYR